MFEPRDGTCRHVGRVAGEEVERDLGPCAGSARGDGMAELVQQRECSERAGEPEAVGVAVEHHDEHHHHDESGSHMDGEPEQPEHCCPRLRPICGAVTARAGDRSAVGCVDSINVPYVYAFDHKHRRPPMEYKDLLGGKGANLAEMTSVLKLPVPPGFTISTDACRDYMHGGWPDGLDEEIAKQVFKLEKAMGRKLGDPFDPLLVSVRSGAKFSMPGMMDTVLNLGLNDLSVEGLAHSTNDERFAYDSYRRFIAMYGRIVLDIDGEPFEHALDAAKTKAGVKLDNLIPAAALKALCKDYLAIVEKATGSPFPQKPRDQLDGAVEAVFKSWNGARAIAYRVREKIDHELGTAVNVQTMVFGNRDDNSGTGVGFTRNAATGENKPYGDFLINAQGEDVVAGIRNTEDLDHMKKHFPEIHADLMEIFRRLERHYTDMCDTEFTIEQGTLWMLQTRVGKRTGAAALKMAVDMTKGTGTGSGRWKITREAALMRVSADHLDAVLHPQFATKGEVLATGLGASPGAAVGSVYFTADEAAAANERGEQVILVRNETSPDDIHGMMASQGILTARGGLVSHAAVVARGWGTPAIVGAEEVKIHGKQFTVRGTVVNEGDVISLDGTTGEVVLGAMELARGRASTRVRDDPEVGRRGPQGQARGSGECRHRRGRSECPRTRCGGHRPVPHRAHVPRTRSTPGGA